MVLLSFCSINLSREKLEKKRWCPIWSWKFRNLYLLLWDENRSCQCQWETRSCIRCFMNPLRLLLELPLPSGRLEPCGSTALRNKLVLLRIWRFKRVSIYEAALRRKVKADGEVLFQNADDWNRGSNFIGYFEGNGHTGIRTRELSRWASFWSFVRPIMASRLPSSINKNRQADPELVSLTEKLFNSPGQPGPATTSSLGPTRGDNSADSSLF